MSFYKALERSLSLERLNAYRQQGGGDEQALCRYLWNLKLCEALYPSLQILEVSFRNAVHSEVARTPAGSEWLKTEVGFLHAAELERIREAKTALTKTRKPLTEAFLIAELSFGFWTSLLDVRYDRMWHKIITGVFPQMPRSLRTRSEASARMSRVRKLRNAALHHHSIWHWADLPQQHEDILTLIEWLCPASHSMAMEVNRFPAVLSPGPSQLTSVVRKITTTP